MKALLDGDILAYRCAASCEPTSKKQFLEDEQVALWRLEKLMQDVIHDTSADSFECWLTGSNNFRKHVYPEYKANRKDMKNPVHLAMCKEYLIEHWDAKISDGCEADDMLGIGQTNTNNEFHQTRLMDTPDPESVIVSIDKDLLQVPGQHYNFVKQEFIEVDEHDGWVRFFTQMILGDRSDNVPGFDGTGRTSVPQFLATDIAELKNLSPEDMFAHVYRMYDDKTQFEINYKLLWVWRQENDPLDFLKQQLGQVLKS